MGFENGMIDVATSCRLHRLLRGGCTLSAVSASGFRASFVNALTRCAALGGGLRRLMRS